MVVGVGGRHGDAQAGRPRRHGGRPDGRHPDTRVAQGGRGGHGPLVAPQDDGHDGARVPGGHGVDVAGQPGPQGVALGRRTTASAARAAAASAGVGAVVKM